MQNFSVKIDGKEYWISRSVAVAAFLFIKDEDNNLCVLANKRGPGTPDFQGYWNCPCGYLDFNETALEAVYREVLEETGVVCPEHMTLCGVDSDPNANHQNVTIRYCGLISNLTYNERAGGEENEVSDIQWIKVDSINDYNWAFNHDKIIWKIIREDPRIREAYLR